MKIGDERAEAAGVILMGVGGDQDVDAADAAGPQIRRDNVLAGIEAGAALTAVLQEPAAVDDHDFSLGEGKQQAVALADVDGGHFEDSGSNLGRGRMPDQQDEGGDKGRGGGPAPSLAIGGHGDGEQRGQEGQSEPEGRIRNAPVRVARGNFQQRAGERGDPSPSGEDREEAERNHQIQQRHDQQIGGEAGEGDAVKIFRHGKRQANLNDQGDHGHFEGEKEAAAKQRDGFSGPAAWKASPELGGFGGQAQLDAELREAGFQVRVEREVVEGAGGAGVRGGDGVEQRGGQRADGGDAEKGQDEAGVEELAGIAQKIEQRDGGEQVEDATAAEKEAGDEIQRESGGGAGHRRGESGDEGVEPGRRSGDGERGNFRQRAETEDKQQHAGEHGHVHAGD